MFDRVCVVGVGLIGGSLAYALKEKELVQHVVAYDINEDHLRVARDLGLIDSYSVDVQQAAADAELIILCTPLSTYEDIAEKIAGILKEGMIVSDVGSVKQIAIEYMCSAFKYDSLWRYYVPAHPIAGTEESGPSSFKETLFQNRNVIITPLENTDRAAAAKVQEMWECIGSHVEYMRPDRHDFIYATVSHSIQLLSTCFAVAFSDVYDDVCDDIDEMFRSFIRLSGSNPVMWRDIFLFNAKSIDVSLDVFARNVKIFQELIREGEVDVLKRNLDLAAKRRRALHDVHNIEDEQKLSSFSYSDLGQSSYVWLDSMPRIISCLVMQGIAESEYAYATGAGLRGFSQNILFENGTEVDDILQHKQPVLKALEHFMKQFAIMRKMLQSEDAKALYAEMQRGNEVYNKVKSD